MIEGLEQALGRLGLQVRGGFPVTDELAAADGIPEIAPGRPARYLLLVGNVGPAMHRAFFAAAGSMPTGPHPLDTWTTEMIAPLAKSIGARPLFPFGGPPWFPFQRWAVRAEGLQASPLGILIHPQYGLWHAYRAALLLDRAIDGAPVPQSLGFPCASCIERPCLSACPADAVSARGYDVGRCAPHVGDAEGSECRGAGCMARRACPVGRDFAYSANALQFHMKAFLAGRNTRGGAGSTPEPDG
jgi:hypothetical protein